MRKLATGSLFSLLVALCLPSMAYAQETSFPTNEEINLAVTQADRAMAQYQLTVEQEETMMGKLGAQAAATDKQIVATWGVASKGFKVKPQAFNSELGLEFVLLLDDASRNAALCGSAAASSASTSAMDRNITQAESILQVGRACTDVSTLLYTVSESVAALYKKYVQADQELVARSVDLMEKCTAILKKSK